MSVESFGCGLCKLSIDQIAELLQIAPRTVDRRWQFARACCSVNWQMIRRPVSLRLDIISNDRGLAMNVKQLRTVQLTNMALWGLQYFCRLSPRVFSKDPKIFDVLMPMFQFILAVGSTWMFRALLKSENSSPQDNDDAK